MGAFLLKRETMKIDRDYGLVASNDELNIYRRLDRQKNIIRNTRRHLNASQIQTSAKMPFMMIGSGDNELHKMD